MMKATSIEQIREHLAKGGRVRTRPPSGGTWEVVDVFQSDVVRVTNGTHRACWDFATCEWELLPIEEQPHDQGHICHELPSEDALDPYSQRKQHLRTKVLHGYTWTPEEQREVWQMLTGEVIEPGKRCEVCGGEGHRIQYFNTIPKGGVDNGIKMPCWACEEHPGYERRPTWMEGGR